MATGAVPRVSSATGRHRPRRISCSVNGPMPSSSISRSSARRTVVVSSSLLANFAPRCPVYNLSSEQSSMRYSLRVGVFLVAFLSALTGCQSRSPQQTFNPQGVHDSGAGLESARAQIDKTLAALNQLVIAQPDQLQTAFDQYSKQVGNMS